jgi:hypothetical protein
MRKINSWLVSFCLIFLFFFSLITNSENAEAPSGPSQIATLGLDQPTQTADVSPGSLGTVEFSGTVSCELNSATTAIVSLTATDTWGTAEVEPPALQFSNTDSGDKVFRVSVQAPLGTSSSESGQVVISGKVIYYPSQLIGTVQPRDGVVGRIDIEPYYDFETYYPSKYQLGWYGSHFVYTGYIENRGNSIDTYSINIDNKKELENKGFVLSLKENEINISERMVKPFKIIVNPPIEYSFDNIIQMKVSVHSKRFFEDTGIELKNTDILRIDLREKSFPDTKCCILIIIEFIIICSIILVPTIYKWWEKKSYYQRYQRWLRKQ